VISHFPARRSEANVAKSGAASRPRPLRARRATRTAKGEELSKEVSTKEQWIEHEYGDASEETVTAAATEAAAAEQRAIVLQTARVRVQLAAGAVAEVERLLGDIDREMGVVPPTARALVRIGAKLTKLAPEVKKQGLALRRAAAALKEAELTSRSASARA